MLESERQRGGRGEENRLRNKEEKDTCIPYCDKTNNGKYNGEIKSRKKERERGEG